MRRRRTIRPVLAAAALVVAVAACSVSTNDQPVAVNDVFDGLVESTTSTSPTSTPESATKTVVLYFVRSSDDETELVPVERELPIDAGAQQILSNLFSSPPTSDGGPSEERGLSSAIPQTAALRSASIPTGTTRLVVDTQGLFGERGVQGPGLRNALGQIVCTVIELEQIDEVTFQNEGRAIGAIVGNNETVDGAVDCGDYRTLT